MFREESLTLQDIWTALTDQLVVNCFNILILKENNIWGEEAMWILRERVAEYRESSAAGRSMERPHCIAFTWGHFIPGAGLVGFDLAFLILKWEWVRRDIYEFMLRHCIPLQTWQTPKDGSIK